MIIASSARGTSGFVLVVIAIAAASTSVAAQADRSPRALVSEERVERAFQPGETHAYDLDLQAHEHARITVDQDRLDLLLSIVAPNGTHAIDVDLQPYYAYGRETIAIVATTASRYRVIIREAQPPRPERPATAGRYAIRVDDVRPARPEDVERAAIERLLLDADRARRQGRRTSLTEARRQFEEAPRPR